MSNITITNVNTDNVILRNAQHADDVFTAAGAGTIPSGTILARLTADQKLVVFVKGGSLGAEIPVRILTNDVVAAGAGDISIRPMISGDVKKEKLIIAADGDDSNVDKAVIDQLQSVSLIALTVQQLSTLDNQ